MPNAQTSLMGIRRLFCCAASWALFVAYTNTLAANAEPQELDDNLRSTIQKEKAKKSLYGSSQSRTGGMTRDNDCGNINIGNEEPKRGSRAVADRNRTVIVTGSVINMPCK